MDSEKMRTLLVSAELHDALKKFADREGRQLQYVVRVFLEEGLKHARREGMRSSDKKIMRRDGTTPAKPKAR